VTSRADRIEAYEQSVIYGYGGNDQITSADGHDTIYGGPGDDVIRSGRGRDVITPGPGNDFVDADGGADVIYAADRQRDTIYCGTNEDRANPEGDVVFADHIDWISRDCEQVFYVPDAERANLQIAISPEGTGGPTQS